MKKLAAIIVPIAIGLLLTVNVFAQTPQKMSYQAVIRNNSDVLVTNTQVGMQISILKGSSSGTAVYTETQTPTTNGNGLVSIEIGGGTGFSTIDWANDIYFIKTETDPSGGTNYSITGTSQLLSVPYALHAKTAESITETDPVYTAWDKSTGISITESQISDLGTYIETEADPSVPVGETLGEMQYWNGTAWVTLTPGNEGAVLTLIGGVPTWTGGTSGQEIVDIDGNTYTSVVIGTQEWMVENLKTTKFNDGSVIPLVTDNGGWQALNTPAYCWYDNDIANKSPYGALYNWYTVNTGKLCPTGWHAPTDADWSILMDHVGGEDVAGGKLKETDFTHWSSPNTEATNEYGFTALPGGYRSLNGPFDTFSYQGFWWSATESNTDNGRSLDMSYSMGDVWRDDNHKKQGYSVRCVKD